MLLTVLSWGCKRETSTQGEVRVFISYSSFRPKCLTLSVEDTRDVSNRGFTEVKVARDARQTGTLTGTLLEHKGWSRDLRLMAEAHEGSCAGPVIARQVGELRFPTEGTTDITLELRAADQDDDGFFAMKGPLPGTDCDDTNNTIHPRQVELTCDGKDDNCNNIPDDAPFNVGGTCETAQRCSGLLACNGTTASQCISTEVPVPYYADDDGDGNAGQVVGIACQPPKSGATRELTDCDEGTTLASRAVGRVEVCDRLDNDCNGATDDGLATCAAVQWRQGTPTVTGNPRFDAVATYAKRRGWLAGEGKVVHVNDATFTVATNCDSGADWKSAWAASQGRVFLGSNNGQFGTLAPGGEESPSELRPSGFTASINGVTGFEESNGATTLYAVTSQGRILRWRYVPGAPIQEAPVEVTQVAASLRAIHGVSPETLIAVGAETVGGQQRPVAFRAPATGTTWIREELGVPNATGFLNAVRVLTPRLAYVVGEEGLLLEKARDTWTQKPPLAFPGGARPTLRALTAFGRTALYAVSSGTNDIHFFNGTAWSTVATAPQTIIALGGSGPGDVWAAGYSATLLRWTPP